MLPKAILFDLDDTIISFDGASDFAWKDICKSFVSNERTSFDENQLLHCISNARQWYWGDPERHKTGRMNMTEARREIVKTALSQLNYFDKDKSNQIADNYSKLQEEMICLFPGSIETLKKLKNLGVRMALITNGSSEKQRWKINKYCLSEFFEFILIEEEVGFGKPDTQVFELALKKLKLKPSDVWMVGDNLVWDIEAPQKLGIFAIWNDYRRKGLPKDSTIIPDRIISEISNLIIENDKVKIEQIKSVSDNVDQLIELLKRVVEDGASIGFLPPLDTTVARNYWESVLAPDVYLFVAKINNRIIGSVQLHLCTKQNGRHRAEIAKLMLDPDYRRRGIGRLLLLTVEEKALQEERSLLVLDTRDGDVSNILYKSMGYISAGQIPRYAKSANEELHTTIFYYKNLEFV